MKIIENESSEAFKCKVQGMEQDIDIVLLEWFPSCQAIIKGRLNAKKAINIRAVVKKRKRQSSGRQQQQWEWNNPTTESTPGWQGKIEERMQSVASIQLAELRGTHSTCGDVLHWSSWACSTCSSMIVNDRTKSLELQDKQAVAVNFNIGMWLANRWVYQYYEEGE